MGESRSPSEVSLEKEMFDEVRLREVESGYVSIVVLCSGGLGREGDGGCDRGADRGVSLRGAGLRVLEGRPAGGSSGGGLSGILRLRLGGMDAERDVDGK